MILCLFSLIAVLNACQSLVPATSPAQLEHTPGVPIIITDNQIDAGWFTLAYPDGWRVVTNEAIAPLRLVLVSPDDEMVIYIFDARNACVYPESTPDPDIYQRRDCIGEEAARLQIEGQVNSEQQDIYARFFDSVVGSIQFR